MITLLVAGYLTIGVAAAGAAAWLTYKWGRFWGSPNLGIIWSGVIGAVVGAAWPLLFALLVGALLREFAFDLMDNDDFEA
jgi:hypothetical protein